MRFLGQRIRRVIGTVWHPKDVPVYYVYCPFCNCVRYLKERRFLNLCYVKCTGCKSILYVRKKDKGESTEWKEC